MTREPGGSVPGHGQDGHHGHHGQHRQDRQVARYNWSATDFDRLRTALAGFEDMHRPQFFEQVVALTGRRLGAAGYPVVLWRRDPQLAGTLCADFHGGVEHMVREARTAAALPAALASLRVDVARGVPASHWSSGLALHYDDPTWSLPGNDELLEAP